jgi:amino acid adenylation domain-containing protein
MSPSNSSLPSSFRYTRSVAHIVSESARRTPESIALCDDAGTWSFRDMEAISDGIGARLAAEGFGKNSVVGVYSSRCAALVPSLLGIWKAGAASVILDSSYPEARLAAQAAAAGVSALLCMEGAGPLPDALASMRSKIRLTIPMLPAAAFHTSGRSVKFATPAADDTAYILFTSGTTGQPKAIATPHSGLPHFLSWYSKAFRPAAHDRFSMLSGLSHDPLMRDLFTPLTAGATLYIPKPDLLKTPRLLLQWMRMNQITWSHLTPSMGRLLARVAQAGGGPLTSLRYAVFGGEPLRYSDVREFRAVAPNAAIINAYGASETPQIMAFHVIEPDAKIPSDGLVAIGEAIDDVEVLLLDERQNVVPVDHEGEIGIRTKYLSKGYLNSPAMTAERFIPNPFRSDPDPEDRIYLTGDHGRRAASLGILYSGRFDSQVKIRGFRVELEEVEMELAKCPMVAAAAAAVDGERSDPGLYAFVQTRPGFDRGDCRKRLAAALPHYMVPTDIFEVAEIPLTPNGKVDRQRLLGTTKRPTDLRS